VGLHLSQVLGPKLWRGGYLKVQLRPGKILICQ
jgi:hypothetical protein